MHAWQQVLGLSPAWCVAGLIGMLPIVAVLLYRMSRNSARTKTSQECAVSAKAGPNEQEVLRLNSELEQRVKDRTVQLEAANRELEAFAYSVSHDLRAPLRSIRGFSEVVLERYSAQLDPQGRELLSRVCQSSRHMDRLIDDLLKFSRLSRAELHRDKIDLSALAESIISELRKAEPEREVEIQIAGGQRASGDEQLLRVVMDSLLRNAWKFMQKQAKPKIEFGVKDQAERVFFVRDNGTGFDMRHASKLFGVFQRLHTAAEFPGNGVGLAIVLRIISRHGGRVWAEAVAGQGAAFFFTLPEDAAS
jgi:light-regulated signal transduction histidine kinase (bacteriophytochrome)